MNTAIYLYCLVRSDRRPSTRRAPSGLPGATHPESAAVAKSLWLIVAEVPLDVYGPSRLDARLRDLDWVSEVAVDHEAVVEHFAGMRGVTVVPMKMFTMFSSLEKAREDVASRRIALQRVLRRVAGCEEWGVRVTRVAGAPQAVAEGGGRTKAAVSRAAMTGAAFLEARRQARDAVRVARVESVSAAALAYDRLAALARDARQRTPRQEPGSNPPILEAAFLVSTTLRSRFKAEARRQAAACAAAGADMTLTGPWPPYNFVAEGRA